MAARLEELLRQRREACAEFESQPVATTADAHSSEGKTVLESGKRHGKSDVEVRDWLKERRNRCEVLQNCPTVGDADALWNREVARSGEGICLESTPGDHVADFKWDDPIHRDFGHSIHSLQRSKLPPARPNLGLWRTLELQEHFELPKTSAAMGRLLEEVLKKEMDLTDEERNKLAKAFIQKYLAYLDLEEERSLAKSKTYGTSIHSFFFFFLNNYFYIRFRS